MHRRIIQPVLIALLAAVPLAACSSGAAKAKDPDVPVIVVSNFITAEKSEQAFDLDAFDIIDRGLSLPDPQVALQREIGKALRLRALSRPQ